MLESMEIDLKSLRKVQKILARWLFTQNGSTWRGIKKVCSDIVLTLPKKTQEIFGNNPEYKILIPLLRNGSIEVCRKKNRSSLYYCMNPIIEIETHEGKFLTRKKPFFTRYQEVDLHDLNVEEIQKTIEPYAFLRSYPAISTQVKTFPIVELDSTQFNVSMNLKSNKYEKPQHRISTVGIYKTNDVIWYPAYLVDKKKNIRKITGLEQNPDALNLARLYIRLKNELYNKESIFVYDEKKITQPFFCKFL